MDDSMAAGGSESRPAIKVRLKLDALDAAARARVEEVLARTLDQELVKASSSEAVSLRAVTVGIIDDDDSDED